MAHHRRAAHCRRQPRRHHGSRRSLGTYGSATGYQRGFSIAQLIDPTTGTNYAAGKTSKETNFRGLTVFNDTLFVSKGSGSNRVNSVYQVGATGALANGLIDQSTYTDGLPWNVQTDGLRNISGTTNADGSFTIFATPSTISDELTHDLGGDPNELVSINIGANSTSANTTFSVLETATAGERLGWRSRLPCAARSGEAAAQVSQTCNVVCLDSDSA